MPYRKMHLARGEYYHLYNHGSGRQRIFREADNCMFVLRLVKKACLRAGHHSDCILPDLLE